MNSCSQPRRRGGWLRPRLPVIGVMLWTLIVFGITLFVLWKVAFPRIAEALDKRQRMIEDSIDTAEKTKREADELLREYRERLSTPVARPTRSLPVPAAPRRRTSRRVRPTRAPSARR